MRGRVGLLAAVLPIWIGPPRAAMDREVVRFSADLPLVARPTRAVARISAQERFRLSINGRPVMVGDSATPWAFDLSGKLGRGANRVEVEVESGAAQGPDNAWVNLERGLPAPVTADRLVIESDGARAGEWLYVEVIDAAGVGSGYYCAERGHPDLQLGSGGGPAVHTIDLRRDSRLAYGGATACDFNRIAAVRIRIDQKTSHRAPTGGVTFRSIRLEGPAPADLGTAQGWVIRPGQGDHRRAELLPMGNGFRAVLDFRPTPDIRLALDLRAFVGDREVGRLVSGERWTTDAGPAVATSRSAGPGGFISDYWPIDIRDIHEVGAAPIRGLADLFVNDGVDRVVAGEPIRVAGRFRSLDGPPSAGARVVALNWAGKVAASALCNCRAEGDGWRLAATLPRLPRGLYRISLDPGAGRTQQSRNTALAVLGSRGARISTLFNALTPFARPIKGMQGVDLSYFDSPALLLGIRELGVNLLQFHLEPSQIDNGELGELIAFCKATGTRFALNNETANWAPSAPGPDGTDRFQAAGGAHRWDIEAPALRKARASGLLQGVVYDENEHMQLCRNFYSKLPDAVHRKPNMVETTGMTLPQAYEAYRQAVKGVADYNRREAGRMLVESVFPVLWHPMARAGVTLCPKLLKEDIHPVVLAQALGAALEYGGELWFSPDLWHMDQMPGHSAREYAAALRLAHTAGVDNVYTEFITCLSLDHKSQFDITPYGAALRDHISRYLPTHTRAYTYRDYRPEVAIIRFPDSDWGGQAAGGYWNTLYGAEDLHSIPETREWQVIWSQLTGGGSNPAAVNTNSSVYDRYQWRFGMSSPAVVMFDHLAKASHIRGIGTLYLCGIQVSAPTLAAVRAEVRRGARCITAARFAPEGMRRPGSYRDGKGEWVVVPAFTPGMAPPWRPPTGPGMTLRFGDRRVTISDP